MYRAGAHRRGTRSIMSKAKRACNWRLLRVQSIDWVLGLPLKGRSLRDLSGVL